jgi:hypothetical protein
MPSEDDLLQNGCAKNAYNALQIDFPGTWILEVNTKN